MYYNFRNNNKNKTLVVLHGFGGNNNCFKKQFHIFNNFFNVVYIDLHSHGNSKNNKLANKNIISFDFLSDDIKEVLDYLKINQAYFLGLSLGTMIIFSFTIKYTKMVQGIIQIAPVINFTIFSKFLLFFVNKIKRFINSNLLYKIFSYILIPNKKYKKSRDIFINEAKKLDEKEFFLWFDLIQTFPSKYNYDLLYSICIDKLYIIGKEDIMFIKVFKKYLKKDILSRFEIIEHAGHICNIDNYEKVNIILYNYFNSLNYY